MSPYAIPTYYNPGAHGYNSEAYLGNNGFYTGIAGDPALYQLPNNGAYTVVTFTNIEVTNAVGEAATGWTLVTGDAESTDSAASGSTSPPTTPGRSFRTPSASLYGNSCYDAHDSGDSGCSSGRDHCPHDRRSGGQRCERAAGRRERHHARHP